MKPSTYIRRLRTLCESWGGGLVETTEDLYKDIKSSKAFYDAPFSLHNLGVLWKNKRIIYAGDVHWPEIIHEMGHVFASKRAPRYCDEYSFFGWEYALAKTLGTEAVNSWMDMHSDYVLSDDYFITLGKLNTHERLGLLEERVRAAREYGLLDKNDMPKAIR